MHYPIRHPDVGKKNTVNRVAEVTSRAKRTTPRELQLQLSQKPEMETWLLSLHHDLVWSDSVSLFAPQSRLRQRKGMRAENAIVMDGRDGRSFVRSSCGEGDDSEWGWAGLVCTLVLGYLTVTTGTDGRVYSHATESFIIFLSFSWAFCLVFVSLSFCLSDCLSWLFVLRRGSEVFRHGTPVPLPLLTACTQTQTHRHT